MKNQIRWLGHSAFKIITKQGKKILIDPWITGNPICPVGIKDLCALDIVLVTHDHRDHYGEDLPFLLESHGILVAQPEVIELAKKEGIQDQRIVTGGSGMNIGGTVEIEGVKVTMTQAVHSSGVGSPCGFIITLEDDTVIYHGGDTGVFASMELFGRLYQIDVALLPIGNVFVMDPSQAALAVELLQPKIAIPMHYKTFPVLEQNADQFVKEVNKRVPQVAVKVIQPGEIITV